VSNKVAELEQRRDVLAADIAERQMRLDGLSGNEELTAVQKLVNDIDAGVRLLGALDRQIAQALETERLARIAAQQAAVEAAAAAAAKVDAELDPVLWRAYELIERRCAVSADSPYAAGKSAIMRSRVLDLLGNVGFDLSTGGPGQSPIPVRR